jgi:hypothetical protein
MKMASENFSDKNVSPIEFDELQMTVWKQDRRLIKAERYRNEAHTNKRGLNQSQKP